MSDVTNYEGRLEQMALYCEALLDNLAKLNNAYKDVSNNAYSVSLPADMIKFKGIKKVGGKTIIHNQLCDFSAQTQTKNGITWTRNADNSYTANGDSGNLASDLPLTPTLNLPEGHKILIMGCPPGGSKPGYFMRNGYGGAIDTGDGVIITIGSDTRFVLQANVWAASVTNVTFHPLTVDLTLMFGAGNEPATVAEFESMFPASYYPYNAGTLLSEGVTEVVSKDSNNATLQTYSIPASIQALEGYGWSCPNHYNYIDFGAKKYVQEVGSRTYANGDESDSTVVTDMTITYYPLTTVVETDISPYLTDDLIQTKAGGTITFPNQNGTDFQIPVPSEIEYIGLT